ncbi:Type I Iterative PKS [Claviceps arundinis]|uniref:Type I Iterative PKS n=1 Tax=Claviceps arundinis TaxID=1623583 RepID=A0A9P7ST06_9HYPO|nr:Type I Iterative PKS [Claviceps arundinis]
MTTPKKIAIVGMSCRLSGDVSTPEDLWTMISRSRDGWGPIPASRFSTDAYYHPNPQKKGCFNTKSGYFMNQDLSQFDAPFFNITEQEAMAMDPQQRQLLECAYEAIESAGIPKETISGASVGVFVGATSSSYRMGTLRDLNQVPLFDSTGNHQSIQAARISHYFNFRGPCLSIDTACSSSLYALHAAVQSLRAGEIDSAIVAGCSLHLQPDDMVSMSMLGIFNNHGKTFSFDHRAKSGFARGEGVGCLVLKPLDAALNDNDKIRCIITNTGTNQDGKTVGLSTPSGEAQEELIRQVYERASISPQDTGYVEAHGTGTKVGDPIEASALNRVFGDGRTKRAPLYIGSVKSNVGHLENASGIISIIKACLMLEKGFILPNVNFEKSNEAIPLEAWHMKIPVNLRPWPKNKKFISINNFGFGGSNAHVILERLPPSLTQLPSSTRDNPKLFTLSANDEVSVTKMASHLSIYLEQHPEIFERRIFNDIAYTLCERRSQFPWRVAITASSCNELAMSLNSVASRPKRALSSNPKVAFVYTGQGAQWAQMGRELIETYPVFSRTIQSAAYCLEKLHAGFSLLDELIKPKEDSKLGLGLAYLSQPCCTAVQLALTDLLSSWGVKPDMVIGHSSGEIVAAYAAGAITLEDAMSAAYYRGQMGELLKTRHPDVQGAMLAVASDARNIRQQLKLLGLNGLAAACHNSPESTTISGDEVEIDQLSAELERQNAFNRKLRVDVAYHSPHMKFVADDYLDSIKTITTRDFHPNVAFYSSLHGRVIESRELGPSYWVNNLTEPVLFSPAVTNMYEEEKPQILIEIGPHSALEGPLKQILRSISPQAAGEVKYLPTLIRNQNSCVALLNLAGHLFTHGYPVQFDQINQTKFTQNPTLITNFPPYPWSGRSYWYESRASHQHRLKPFPRHDILGLLDCNYTDSELTWRNVLSVDEIPWLKDHRMQSLVTFPLAGYLCMAVEAACQRAQLRQVQPSHISSFHLREIEASKALIMDSVSQYETVVSLRPYTEGTRSLSNDWDEFFISSWAPNRGWLQHCRGLVRVKKLRGPNPVNESRFHSAHHRRAKAHAQHQVSVPTDVMYTELAARGAEYGPAFINKADDVSLGGNYSFGSISKPDTASYMHSGYETVSKLPISFMDLIFQFTFPLLGAGSGTMPSLFMPSAIKDIEISMSFPNTQEEKLEVIAYGHWIRFSSGSSPGSVEFAVDGWHASCAAPVVTMTGFKMSPIIDETSEHQGPRSLCYKIDWRPLGSSSSSVRAANSECQMSGCLTKGNTHAKAMDNETSASIRGNDVQSGVHIETASSQKAGPSMHVNGSTGTNSVIEHSLAGLPTAPLHEKKTQLVLVTDRVEEDQMITSLVLIASQRLGVEAEICSFTHVRPNPSSHYICLDELDYSLISGMTEANFSTLKSLLLDASSVLWVTSGAYCAALNPDRNLAQGIFRSVRSETQRALATLDLDPRSQLDVYSKADLVIRAFESYNQSLQNTAPVDFEFHEREGQLFVPRVIMDETLNGHIFHTTQPSVAYAQKFQQGERRLKMMVGTSGALDSLFWTDDSECVLASDEIEICVAYTGINFKDVMIAMGQLSSPYIGIECSGVVARIGSNVSSIAVGDRVCAVSMGAYSAFARSLASSAVVIPRDMPLAVAATIPVVYCTAYYGIIELARLQAGESILIHAASGGVGQASIQLAQMVGAVIYATVGTAEKKKLLVNTYGIPESHVFYSRDAEFGPAIRYATNGRGVDVVINSLAGDLLRESWASLAPFGRFIEIGKRDINSNSRLDMFKFDSNCTFSSVDLTIVAAERPQLMSRIMRSVMDLVTRGVIKPIGPIIEKSIEEVESSLRMLQSGKTSGKLVVDHIQPARIKATHHVSASSTIRKDATYLIIGGTGGIGGAIAAQFVNQGAGHLVLLSRGGRWTADIAKLAEVGKASGSHIHVMKCDVGDEESVSLLLSKVRKSLPPVRGIIHAAMVLKDTLFEKMTFQDYQEVVRSKISGTLHFDKALENEDIDFFVLLSSVAGIVGNRGQAAYSGANTFLDAFARYRRQRGLAAISLNLTAVEDVGYLASNASRKREVLRNISGDSMSEKEVLALVDAALSGKICDAQSITGLDLNAPTSLPFWIDDGKFSILREKALASGFGSASAISVSMSLAERLKCVKSLNEAIEMVASDLGGKLASILMMAPEDMEAQKDSMSITAFGLDSLNAIELRNWIGKELQAHLQVLELLSSGRLKDLAALVLNKSRLDGAWTEKRS